MMKRLLLATLFCVESGSVSAAFDVNECILKGMRGVASDVAAKQVRAACNEKEREYERRLLERVSKEFGERLERGTLPRYLPARRDGGGTMSIDFKNTTDKTVTYIRLQAYPSPWGPGCERTELDIHEYRRRNPQFNYMADVHLTQTLYEKFGEGTSFEEYARGFGFFSGDSSVRLHSYRFTLKPSGTVKLTFPSFQTPACVNVQVALARPPSWSDVSFSNSISPVSTDPLAELFLYD